MKTVSDVEKIDYFNAAIDALINMQDAGLDSIALHKALDDINHQKFEFLRLNPEIIDL